MINPFAIHKALRRNGIVGINARNLDYIFAYNDRSAYPIVDDKITTKEFALRSGVTVPEQYAVVEFPGQFDELVEVAKARRQFVVKPARGAGGGGILVISGVTGAGLRKASGHLVSWDEVRFHVNNICGGMYSLGGGSDRALVEQRINPHSAFSTLAFKGVPDVRTIVFRGLPVMAMLRLPTSLSDGKANLHVGGVGAGVDLETGVTTHGVCFNQPIERHPDFETEIAGFQVPSWPDVLTVSASLGHSIGLGYVGVDLVIDERQGPTMLELNARPGIAIQIANQQGLERRLRAIRDLETIPDEPEDRVALALEIWRDKR